MLDLTVPHVLKYQSIVDALSEDFISEDYSELEELELCWNKDYINGNWFFKICKAQDGEIVKTTYTKPSLQQFLLDENILCYGVNSFPPGTHILDHKDPPYMGRNNFRILVPVECENAILRYDGNDIIPEVGKTYLFDLTHVWHGGRNFSTTNRFTIITIDVKYIDRNEYTGEDFQGHMFNDLDMYKYAKMMQPSRQMDPDDAQRFVDRTHWEIFHDKL